MTPRVPREPRARARPAGEVVLLLALAGACGGTRGESGAPRDVGPAADGQRDGGGIAAPADLADAPVASAPDAPPPRSDLSSPDVRVDAAGAERMFTVTPDAPPFRDFSVRFDLGPTDAVQVDLLVDAVAAADAGSDGPPAMCRPPAAPVDPSCPAGLGGSALFDGESLSGWTVEADGDAQGALVATSGAAGSAVRLDYDLGTGRWLRARFTPTAPLDLSAADLLALTVRGGGPDERPLDVSVVLLDSRGPAFVVDVAATGSGASARGLNQVDRWMRELVLPRKQFRLQTPWTGDPQALDWTRIERVAVMLSRPTGTAADIGTLGRFTIDTLSSTRAAAWPRMSSPAPACPRTSVSQRAAAFLISQQQPSALFLSWPDEPAPLAHVKDQGLALAALSHFGLWSNGIASSPASQSAARLAAFLAAQQKPDGHVPSTWNAMTRAVLSDEPTVLEQAWATLGLAAFGRAASNAAATTAAQKAGAYLAGRLDANAKGAGSTETGAVAWSALRASGRTAAADAVLAHLLATSWDPDLRYARRSDADPAITLEAATTLAAVARHPTVARPELADDALTFVHRTLLTRSGAWCGLDGAGPVTLWLEGVARIVSARGRDGEAHLDLLAAQQRADGALPVAVENWSSPFGVRHTGRGLAATAWLYFAASGASPFDGAGI